MKKSYKSILLLFVVMILTMSAVNAAEIDDTSDSVVQAADVDAIDEVATADVDDVVAASDDGAEVLTDVGDKNFTVLQDEINSASGLLEINSNYVRSEGESDIEITKNILLLGDDTHKIDAQSLGGIFKINSGITLTLNNVILVNGNNDNGGAIYNEGTVNIISSELTDNSAKIGGAIYNKGIASISGSTLNGNIAATKGGAVYSEGTLVVSDSSFENNKITTGDSYTDSLVDCNGGGAIYASNDVRVTGSTFTKNTAPHDEEVFSAGGAIYIKETTAIIDDCTFNENSAVYGGAVMFEKFNQDSVAIKDSRFNGNQAWQGGAINGNDLVGSLIITGSNFTANKVTTPNAGSSSPKGGAIMVGTKSYTGIALDVASCNFVENDGGYMGGAIASSPDNTIKVDDSNFTGNKATDLGGAIVTGTGTDLTVSGSTFTDNKVSATGMGGAIFAEPNSKNDISGSTFTNNVDRYPSAIMSYQGTLELADNTFDDSGVFNYGGAITSEIKAIVLNNETLETDDGNVALRARVTDDNDNVIRDSTLQFVINGEKVAAVYDVADGYYKGTYTLPAPGFFTVGITSSKNEDITVKTGKVKNIKGSFSDLQGKINDAGGTLDLTYDFIYTEGIDDGSVEIEEDIIINGNGHTISGSDSVRILNILWADEVTLNNITFIEGSAGYAGAIYSCYTLTINDCTFENNTATEQGGAIYNDGGDLTITNSVFNNNKVSTGDSFTDSQAECNGGGAIYNTGDLFVTGSNFTKNTAPHDTEIFSAGGAIYNKETDDCIVLIDDCTFEENSAVYGGAVMFEKFNQDSVAIKDSRFNGNQAWQGGAINGNDLVGSLIIEGSNFIANKAVTPNAGQSSPCGGAIMVGTKSHTGVALDVAGCKFEDNSAVYMGGAIASSPDNTLKVIDSNFTGNVASALGGAIVTGTGTELTVSDSTFTDNKVGDTGMGGAIFCEPGSTNDISGSTFTNNVDRYPSAIMSYQGTLELADNTFDDNGVFNYAGTITSEIKAVVLNNETVTAYDDTVTLTAKITDDNDNVIRDSTFQFVINGEPVTASYNTVTKLYQATYTLPALGVYPVTITSTKNNDLTIKTGAIKNVKGTFTALNDLIKDANEVNLTGNFTYDAETDGVAFVNGIVIDHALTINGNGYTINGNNVARIFNVVDETTLKNVTLTKGSSVDNGGAIYTTAPLTIIDSVFDDNKITQGSTWAPGAPAAGGAAIFAAAGSSLNVKGTNFTNNAAVKDTYNRFTCGAVYIVNADNVLIDDCLFENNAAVLGGALTVERFSQDTVAVKDSVFNDNIAWQGGAININEYVGKFIITGSNFTTNQASSPDIGDSTPQAGAIMIGPTKVASEISVVDCEFTDNTAPNAGTAILVSDTTITANIDDCNFVSTSGSSSGSTIYTVGTLSLANSTIDATNGWAIVNLGNLALKNNNINKGNARILSFSADSYVGTITSEIKAVVLGNQTVKTAEDKYTLNATLTDDNGNIVYDLNLRFVVNGVTVATQPTFSNGVYVLSDYPITTDYSTYLVTVTSSTDEIIVETGIIENLLVGTFTDLQARINAAGTDLILPYDFTYNEEIDGAALKEGVVISQEITIDGNGTTVSGADLARIFKVNAKTTLKNITLANGSVADNGAAIYATAPLTVENSVFDNNKVTDGTSWRPGYPAAGGAAIYAAPGSSLKVTGTNFTNNVALKDVYNRFTAGAVYISGASALLIEDCLFENNAAVLGGALTVENFAQDSVAVKDSVFNTNTAWQGGAINLNENVDKFIIEGSNFTSNNVIIPNIGSSTPSGGAIAIGTMESKANAVITGCVFTANESPNGGSAVISYNSNDDVKISESEFKDNVGSTTITNVGNMELTNSNITAADGWAIYNVANLKLAGNNIIANNGIYNNANIISTINATLIGGQDINAALGDEVVPTATLTDDNGNVIYDPNFNITINGQELETSYANGLYTATYTIETAGDKVVSTSYTGATVTEGKYIVPKANVTEFSVAVEDIIDGENATVLVTLTGVNDIGLNDTVTVIVNNKEYAITVTDGKGNKTIEGLAHGQYPVVAMLDESANYNNAIDSTVFYVKGTSILTIDEITTAEFGQEIKVNIGLTDGEGNLLTGIVVIDGVNVFVEDGNGIFVIDNQPDVGEYDFTAVYEGDDDYSQSSAEFKVNVTAKVLTDEDVYISIYSDAPDSEDVIAYIGGPAGTYHVTVDGQTVDVEVSYNEEENSTYGTATITGVSKGPQVAAISFDSENYVLDESISTYEFNNVATPEFEVEFDATYPEVKITITGTPGNYTVYMDEDHSVTIEVTGTTATGTISDVAPGTYEEVEVAYEGNDYYSYLYKYYDVTVDPATPEFTVEVVATPVAYPGDVQIKVNASVAGKVTITLDKDYVFDVEAGVTDLTIPGLAVGTYSGKTVHFEADNYASVDKDITFEVTKGTPTINVETVVGKDTYPGTVTVIVTSDVDGTYNITVGTQTTPVPVTNGVGYTTFTNVAASTQNAIVTFIEDASYKQTSADKEFTIAKAAPEFTVEIAETTYPEAVKVTIKGTDGTYHIQGTEIKVTDGQGSGEITGLAAGTYTDVAVTYDANDNYDAASATVNFTVKDAEREFTVTVAVINDTYPGKVNITITGAAGTYNITIGEIKDQITVVTDNASKVISGLSAGDKTLVTVLPADGSYAEITKENTFTINKAAMNPTVIVPEKAEIGENFTVTATAFEGAASVEINGKTYALNENISLPEGTYDVKVIFEGNENVAGTTVEKTINVTKKSVKENALNITVPENSTAPTFSINLTDDATGYLLVDIDGEQYYAPLVNGSASITTAPLAGGNHTVTVTYTGDENYAGFTNTTQLSVESNVTADSALDIPASSETNSPTFSVNLPSDATGYLIVDVDGKKYAAVVENGKASVTVPGLSDGNHNVTVSYSGDSKYPALSKSTTLNVHVPVYAVTQNKNINVRYSASASYRVLITKDGKAVGAGESVTIKFNGKTYTVKTDANGYATLKLNTKVKVKKYTITATYKGITVKNTVKVKNIIKAKNKKVKKSKKVTKVAITLYKVNGKYLKKVKVKIKFRGKTYKVKTNKKGKAVWKVKKSMLKKLKVGKKYKYRVTYGKDVVTKKLTIKR